MISRWTIGLMMCGALALAGCGRRGFPEAPPDASSGGSNSATTAAGTKPSGAAPKKDTGVTKPNTSFFLDPLL